MNLPRLTKAKLFFLSILLTTTVIGIFFLFWTSTSNNTYQPTLSETLTTQRQQILTEIQNKLTMHRLNENKLNQKLKEKHPTFIDLNSYLKTANSTEELNTLHQEIKTTITLLTQSPPNPNPQPQPENRWQKILREIREFMQSNPTNYQKIKDWLDEKNYPEPLAGIDLKGVGNDELKKLSIGSKAPDDFDGQDNTREYKDWIQLPAAGDGNCFLHSYAVFLTGKSDLELTQRLRVAICLLIMKSPGTFFSWSEDWILSKLKEVILKDDFTFNGRWLESTHAEYLAFILKRPLVVISKIPKQYQGSYGGKYQYFKYPDHNAYAHSSVFFIPETSSEKWVIYNSGNHFQPIIKK